MKEKKKVLVINGPNINMLGLREPDIYGTDTYEDMLELTRKTGDDAGVRVELFQSNHEGEIVDRIQKAYGEADGIVINPAAYTHTSIAILDALKAVGIPTVEVHISDVDNREDFRRHSYIASVAVKTITGKGIVGYAEAIYFLKEKLTEDD